MTDNPPSDRILGEIDDIMDSTISLARECVSDAHHARTLALLVLELPENETAPQERAAACTAIEQFDEFFGPSPALAAHRAGEKTSRPAVPSELLPDGPVVISGELEGGAEE